MRSKTHDHPYPVIAAYGTDLMRTCVLDLGDAGFAWIRSPGPAMATPLPAPPASVRDLISRLPRDAVRPALPERVQDGVRYDAPGPVSLAGALLTGDDPARTGAAPLLRSVGRTLRRVHESPVPADVAARPPRGPARLAERLSAKDEVGRTARLRTLIDEVLGADRLCRVSTWCEGLMRTEGAPVLLHGGPSLGALVPDRSDPGRGALFTGEDVTPGPWTFDLGWLLGEILELGVGLRAVRPGTPPPGDLARALFAGYGRSPVPSVGRAAAVRILTHAYDFAAFAGWHEESLRRSLTLVADLIDSDGAAALTW
ncbi:phosphotransferase [Actinoallomurus soli]|uniref:phosphotransferase n=1 Tax=Actinoallomurus soli TaxID=2952535 RepID=UPI002093CE6E|nr:phosphotransferase [Actinoallomurus soli]MCO5971639.1 aminoglycoside phosphotransferase family protein [Actinoallomurus soli]